MTFDQIKKAVKDYCNLTSQDADTRVGEAINRHYQRVTSALGMDLTRNVTRSATTTSGVRTVTFQQIEKIDWVIDVTDSSSIRELTERGLHEIRTTQPGSGQPSLWAPQSVSASSVTIVLDAIPQTAYTLQADGWSTQAILQGDDEPAFAESYHDVLTWSVLAEELLKKEKVALAREYSTGDPERPGRAERLLSELIHHYADSHTREDRQGRRSSGAASSSSSSGSATLGTTAYTQSALVTYDLGSGVAPFAVARSNAPTVTNLDADKLDGEQGAFYLDRANHTGTSSTAVTAITPVTTDRLIGRDTAGSGAAEQLTVGGGLEFTGSGGIQRSALAGGDVTAPAASAVATIANDAVTYAKMQNVSAASRLLGRGSGAGSGDPEELTIGTGLSLSGTDLAALITTSVRQIVTVQATGDFSTTSATNVSITNASISITTGAGATVLVIATVPCRITGGQAWFDWSVDSVDDGAVQGVIGFSGNITLPILRVATGLSAAAHTFQLRVKSSAGGTINVDMSSVCVGKLVAIEYR